MVLRLSFQKKTVTVTLNRSLLSPIRESSFLLAESLPLASGGGLTFHLPRVQRLIQSGLWVICAGPSLLSATASDGAQLERSPVLTTPGPALPVTTGGEGHHSAPTPSRGRQVTSPLGLAHLQPLHQGKLYCAVQDLLFQAAAGEGRGSLF